MMNRIIRFTFWLTAGCTLAAATVRAESSEVPAAFMKQLVQGINARDLAALRGIMHPDTLKCLTQETGSYYAWRFWKDGSKRYVIASNYKVSVEKPLVDIKSANMPSDTNTMRWPVQPDATLNIHYQPALKTDVQRQFEITLTGGKALLVSDCPTALGLREFHEQQDANNARDKKLAQLWHSMPAADQETFKRMATSGKKLDGMKAAEQKFQLSPDDSLALMDMIQYADTP